MGKSTLDGPARRKVDSLRTALKQANPDSALVRQRYGALCGMLGAQFGKYRQQVIKILGEDLTKELKDMTTFEL